MDDARKWWTERYAQHTALMAPLTYEYWLERVRDVAADTTYEDEYGMIELAAKRLHLGTVSDTRFGTRVELALGDERGSAEAYWPDREGGCLCYSHKSRGRCSHELAARVVR